MVAFDEAGNTGQHLLDEHRPVFVLASTSLPPEAATELLRPLIPPGAREAKFAGRRGAQFERAVLHVLNADAITPETVMLGAYHKPFMLTTKIVDLLVEPLAHQRGHNLYAKGENLALANLIHTVTPAFCGEDALPELHRRFLSMVRYQSRASIDAFYIHVAKLMGRSVVPGFEPVLRVILHSERSVDKLIRDKDLGALEPALPAFVELASHWTGTLDSAFDIVHDVSKPLAREREQLERLMRERDKPMEVIHHGRRAVFPIRCRSLSFVDSKEYPQVQLADVIAGSFARLLRARALGNTDPFADAIARSRLASPNAAIWLVWPDSEVDPQTLGTEDWDGGPTLEYVADLLGS